MSQSKDQQSITSGDPHTNPMMMGDQSRGGQHHIYSSLSYEEALHPKTFKFTEKLRHPFQYLKQVIQDSTAPPIPIEDIQYNEMIHKRIESTDVYRQQHEYERQHQDYQQNLVSIIRDKTLNQLQDTASRDLGAVVKGAESVLEKAKDVVTDTVQNVLPSQDQQDRGRVGDRQSRQARITQRDTGRSGGAAVGGADQDQSAISAAIDTTQDYARKALQKGEDLYQKGKEQVQPVLSTVQDKAQPYVDKAKSEIKSLASDAADYIRSDNNQQQQQNQDQSLIQSAKVKIQDVYERPGENLRQAKDQIVDKAYQAKDLLMGDNEQQQYQQQYQGRDAQQLKEKAKDVGRQAKDFVQDKGQQLKDQYQNMDTQQLKNQAYQTGKQLKDQAEDKASQYLGDRNVQQAKDKAKDVGRQAQGYIQEKGQELKNQYQNMDTQQLKNQAYQTGKQIKDQVQDKTQQYLGDRDYEDLKYKAKDTGRQAKDFVQEKGQQLKDQYQNMDTQQLKNQAYQTGKQLKDQAEDKASQYLGERNLQQAKDKAKDVGRQAQEFVQEKGQQLKKQYQNLDTEQLKDKAYEAGRQAKDKALDTGKQLKEQFAKIGQQTGDTLQLTGNEYIDRAKREAWERSHQQQYQQQRDQDRSYRDYEQEREGRGDRSGDRQRSQDRQKQQQQNQSYLDQDKQQITSSGGRTEQDKWRQGQGLYQQDRNVTSINEIGKGSGQSQSYKYNQRDEGSDAKSRDTWESTYQNREILDKRYNQQQDRDRDTDRNRDQDRDRDRDTQRQTAQRGYTQQDKDSQYLDRDLRRNEQRDRDLQQQQQQRRGQQQDQQRGRDTDRDDEYDHYLQQQKYEQYDRDQSRQLTKQQQQDKNKDIQARWQNQQNYSQQDQERYRERGQQQQQQQLRDRDRDQWQQQQQRQGRDRQGGDRQQRSQQQQEEEEGAFDNVIDMAKDAGSYVGQKAEQVYDSAKDTVQQYTPSTVHNIFEKVKDIAEEGLEFVRDSFISSDDRQDNQRDRERDMGRDTRDRETRGRDTRDMGRETRGRDSRDRDQGKDQQQQQQKWVYDKEEAQRRHREDVERDFHEGDKYGASDYARDTRRYVYDKSLQAKQMMKGDVIDRAGDMYESAKDSAGDLYEKAKDTVKDYTGLGQQRDQNYGRDQQQRRDQDYNRQQQYSRDQDESSGIIDQAKGALTTAKDTIQSAGQDIYQGAKGMFGQTRDTDKFDRRSDQHYWDRDEEERNQHLFWEKRDNTRDRGQQQTQQQQQQTQKQQLDTDQFQRQQQRQGSGDKLSESSGHMQFNNSNDPINKLGGRRDDTRNEKENVNQTKFWKGDENKKPELQKRQENQKNNDLQPIIPPQQTQGRQQMQKPYDQAIKVFENQLTPSDIYNRTPHEQQQYGVLRQQFETTRDQNINERDIVGKSVNMNRDSYRSNVKQEVKVPQYQRHSMASQSYAAPYPEPGYVKRQEGADR